MKSKELYPRVFSQYAEAYKRRLDDIWARGEARGRLRMIELAGLQSGMRVLDLACGPGNITRLVATEVRPGGHVVGVDLASGMIEVAKHQLVPPGTDFAVMDMEHLGFNDRVFDAVVCGHGLQFAPDLGQALHEAGRVLRSSAVIAASVPAPSTDDRVWELIDSVIDRYLPPAPQATDEAATRKTIGDPEAFRTAALTAGFESAEVDTVIEEVVWESAGELVSKLLSWWRCATRVDAVDPRLQQQILEEATAAVSGEYPGAITTYGRNLVLTARNR